MPEVVDRQWDLHTDEAAHFAHIFGHLADMAVAALDADEHMLRLQDEGLDRRYDRVVFPRVQAFSARHPNVTELAHLQAMLCEYKIGRSTNDITALLLLEQAAATANFPLREVDGAIWKIGARSNTDVRL